MKPGKLFLFLLILITGCNLLPKKQPATKIEVVPEIIGSWKLLQVKGVDKSGHIHYPYDKSVEGFAVFDKQQNFSIQYYDASRSGMSHADPYYCSDAEIRIAFLSGVSYFGDYKLSGDSLQLNIKASVNPNLNYRKGTGVIKLQGDTLLLITPSQKLNGIYLQEHSVWKRSGK